MEKKKTSLCSCSPRARRHWDVPRDCVAGRGQELALDSLRLVATVDMDTSNQKPCVYRKTRSLFFTPLKLRAGFWTPPPPP